MESRVKGQERVLLFLFHSVVTYLGRVNISIAGISIEREYGLNRLYLGTIFSAFVVMGYMLFQIPGQGRSRYLLPSDKTTCCRRRLCGTRIMGIPAWHIERSV